MILHESTQYHAIRLVVKQYPSVVQYAADLCPGVLPRAPCQPGV